MPLDKLDKSFKTSINKIFTTPQRDIYQEKSGKTLNLHRDDIWADPISITPSIAVTDGTAEEYIQQVLTPDPVYPENVFFFMVDSGSFVAGVDDYDTGIANNAERNDFISNKYGDSYLALLYDNLGNLISETDPIEWLFDYVTGVLHISNASSYPTPYKLTIYRYVGNFVPTFAELVKEFNLTDKNLLASITTVDGDLACNTAISEEPLLDSGVRVYLNNIRVESGNTAKDYCYFSNDGGTSKRAFGSEIHGDLLYWNGSIAEYQLEVDDLITFDYLVN